MTPTTTEKFLNLDAIEQVQITRSFSRKVQMDQYEPIEAFASVQATIKGGTSEEDILRISKDLHNLAAREIDRDVDAYIKSHTVPF